MTKDELIAILKYVSSGKRVEIKVTGYAGCYNIIPIDGVKAGSDMIVLECHDENIWYDDNHKNEE